MRLNINLATKPYQDVRRILMLWGGPVVLLAVCTFALLGMAVSNWRTSRDVNQKIHTLQAEIAGLDRQREQAIALLHQPQNSTVVDNSKFLNGLIARKSFSWTRVFMQLERIMPAGLHVVSIAPQLQPQTNTVQMHLSVAGTSRDAAVELVRRLEQSPSFHDARIVSESASLDRNSPDTVRFDLTAIYTPTTSPDATAAATNPDKGANPANQGGAR